MKSCPSHPRKQNHNHTGQTGMGILTELHSRISGQQPTVMCRMTEFQHNLELAQTTCLPVHTHDLCSSIALCRYSVQISVSTFTHIYMYIHTSSVLGSLSTLRLQHIHVRSCRKTTTGSIADHINEWLEAVPCYPVPQLFRLFIHPHIFPLSQDPSSKNICSIDRYLLVSLARSSVSTTPQEALTSEI